MKLFPQQFGLRSLLIFSLKESPCLPYEFTVAGMLERLNAYLEHQVNAHCKFTLPACSLLYSVSLIGPRRSWRAVVWSYLLSKPVIETELQDIRILSFLVIQKIFAISEGLFFAANSMADTSPTWKIQWNPALRSPRWYGHFFWSPGKNRHTFSCKKKKPS